MEIPASSFCWIRLGATKPLLEDKRVAMATGITQQTTTPKTFFMATRTETYIRVSQSLKNRDEIDGRERIRTISLIMISIGVKNQNRAVLLRIQITDNHITKTKHDDITFFVLCDILIRPALLPVHLRLLDCIDRAADISIETCGAPAHPALYKFMADAEKMS